MLKLKEFRKLKGLSQSELARRVGLTRQTYNNYELGKREADYETLLRLAEELDTTVQDILGQQNDDKIEVYKNIIQKYASMTEENQRKVDEFIKLVSYFDAYQKAYGDVDDESVEKVLNKINNLMKKENK